MCLPSRRIGAIESLEQRQLMAGDTMGAVTPDVEPAAMIYVKIPGLGDDAVLAANYEPPVAMIADSFGFAIEPEMKESGEKGGTTDINIGVGELQECTISKSMDMASPNLAQFAINGNSPGIAEIDFVEVADGDETADEQAVTDLALAEMEEDQAQCYLKYKLDRCFVKSWSISGDADDRPTEEVAFYYNKIGFAYARTTDG